MAKKNVERIVILCLPGIGDALMATPMIRTLRENKPEAIIDVVCMLGGVEYILKNNPFINKIHKISIYQGNLVSGLKDILGLRRHRYDISILAFPAYRREYHIVHWLIGAKRRIAHRYSKGFWGELHFLNTDLVATNEEAHNVINNLNLLKVLGVDWQKEVTGNIKYDLILDPDDVAVGAKYIKDLGWREQDIIGFHPGSTNSLAGLMKRWPIDRYAEIACYLTSKNKKVLVFIGPDEIGLAEGIKNQVGSDDCHIVSGLKLGQALGVLSKVQMLLCNDNGFSHLANALGVRTAVLMAPTFDMWSRPYDERLVQIIRPDGYEPWHRYELKRAVPKDVVDGMALISVEQVKEALKGVSDGQ